MFEMYGLWKNRTDSDGHYSFTCRIAVDPDLDLNKCYATQIVELKL